MSIFEKFLKLPLKSVETSFEAIALDGKRKDFLAKDFDGAPIFLLHDASRAEYKPGIDFKNLKAVYHATCRVRTENIDLEDQFALVSCDGAATELHEIFIRCFSAAIEELPVAAGTMELDSCIQKLLDIFRVLSKPGVKDVLGLWGELYVISNSGKVADAMAAWHEDQMDRFDFSWNHGSVEVKTCAQTVRVHHFDLEQLMNPMNATGHVISIMLQPLSGGLGIVDLANAIESKIQKYPKLKQKLWNNISKALGSDFSEKLDKRFDASYAERNAVIYAMSDIPRPVKPQDPRVLRIKFSVDLTTVESSLTKKSLLGLSGVF